MTTTLRPAGPLQQTEDGLKSRIYDVCDNSRPVGVIEIGTGAGFGSAAGTLRHLRVNEADRRRGRATIAALAAEEILRGWGCGQVLASLPAEAQGAGQLFESLGYTERSRNMLKRLPAEPPPLPPGVDSRPMDEAEFVLWWARLAANFAQSWIDRGVPEEQAHAKAEAVRREQLPDGLASPGLSLSVLLHDGAAVGRLWLGDREVSPGVPAAFVYDVEVTEDRRGKGFGRALMLLAERISHGNGLGTLGLHVFAGNTPAIGLYESLGYATTHRNVFKPLL